MSSDLDAVQDVVNSLSDEARQLLQRVLQIERERLHIRSADVTDEIVQVVKGLMP